MKLIPLVLIGSVAIAGAAAFLTNPKEEDYAQFASQRLTEEVQASLCEASGIPPLSESLDNAISGFCKRTVGRVVSSEAVEEIVLKNTERQNRLFFSTYETALPRQTYKSVGVFNRFYPYGNSWSDSKTETAE